MGQLNLRRLEIADAEQIEQILILCATMHAQPAIGLPTWSLESLRESLQAHAAFGVEDDLGLVAFVLVQQLPDAIEVLHLATHPRSRRKGVMIQLLTQLIQGRSADQELWLEVHEGNQSARSLYEKLGFEAVGRRPRYYADGGAAVLYNLR